MISDEVRGKREQLVLDHFRDEVGRGATPTS
jgi:hypothetical protein